ncbi:MAG: lipopolysaccharide assembly protein LapA domain-containing protein [Gammaproteobacteria bacterium]|nr:lipopolysaccharide assembly protein LapA domain-containing protein [Gammaproteobacteria bacterium]
MRLFLYLIWFILIIFGVSFSVLNSHSFPINYFIGQKTIYFPLLFLLLLFLGTLLGVFAMLPVIIKLKLKIHQLRQKIKSLEETNGKENS